MLRFTFRVAVVVCAMTLLAAFAAPALAAPSSSAGSGGMSGSNSIVVLILGLAAGCFVLLLFAAWRRMASGQGEPADSDGSAFRTSTGSEDESVSNPRKRSVATTARRAAVVAVIVLMSGVAMWAGLDTAKPRSAGDAISKTFSSGQPCATVTIALSVPAGADPAATADTLFAALEPVAGMNTASYNAGTSSVEVGFCESKASEGAIRQALAPTGMVGPTGAVESPTP
jgi:hypothetical protein